MAASIVMPRSLAAAGLKRVSVAKPAKLARSMSPLCPKLGRQQHFVAVYAEAEEAAAAEEVVAEEPVAEEPAAEDAPVQAEEPAAASTSQAGGELDSWIAEGLDPSLAAEPTTFKLNFLWMSKNIAVSVDQVFAKGQKSPVTEYFFWPRMDAWVQLQESLDARPWLDDRQKISLLNRTTEVINFWQDETTEHSLEEAVTAFPDCSFRN